MLERDPKRRRLTPLNAPFRSPLHRSSGERAGSSANPSKSSNLNGSKSLPNTPVRRLPPRQFKSPVLGRNDEGGLTPDVLALIHRKRELEAQIKAEKNSIETAQLALKYEKQDEDENLERLIVKWRRCAQRTAERVFVRARDRIDRMGGFKEYMRNQRQRAVWDDSTELSENESQDREKETEAEEEEFTMEIMLKMAGVDEVAIGWNRELNNFVKM